LGEDDHAGFISFSAKLWLPDRYKCANGPPKGPPILSPWKEWNKLPIPKPNSDYLNWLSGFQIRAHIYQARNLLQGMGFRVQGAGCRVNGKKSNPRTHLPRTRPASVFSNQEEGIRVFEENILFIGIEYAV